MLVAYSIMSRTRAKNFDLNKEAYSEHRATQVLFPRKR